MWNMSNSDDNYNGIGVLLEEIRDQNKAVLEAVGGMQTQIAKIPAIEERLGTLQDDVTATKAAVKDLSQDVKVLQGDVTALKSDVKVLQSDVTDLKSDVTDLKDDMKVVKAAVTDQDKQFKNHERRITRLETKLA